MTRWDIFKKKMSELEDRLERFRIKYWDICTKNIKEENNLYMWEGLT